MPIYSDDMYRLALTREYVGPYVFTDGKLEYSSFAGTTRKWFNQICATSNKKKKMEIKSEKNRRIACLFMIICWVAICPIAYSQEIDNKAEITSWKAISIDAPSYFVDTVHIDNPIVLMDKKTNFCFIKSENGEDLEKLSRKNSKYLLSHGWVLLLEYWQVRTPPRPYKASMNKFYNIYTLMYEFEDYGSQILKKYGVYIIDPKPNCFFLFMVKGREIHARSTNVLDGGWGEIKFKDDDAYYPVVLPAYPHDLK